MYLPFDRQPSTHKIPSWMRTVFIRALPKMLLMRVPEQLLADSALKQKQMKTCKKLNLNLARYAFYRPDMSNVQSRDEQ